MSKKENHKGKSVSIHRMDPEVDQLIKKVAETIKELRKKFNITKKDPKRDKHMKMIYRNHLN